MSFAGAVRSSVVFLGDDCDPVQVETFRAPTECTVALRNRGCYTLHHTNHRRSLQRPDPSRSRCSQGTRFTWLGLALGEATRRPATESPLDLLLTGVSYQLSDKPEGHVWIKKKDKKKDHSPIADTDLLSRGGNPIKQRSFFRKRVRPVPCMRAPHLQLSTVFSYYPRPGCATSARPRFTRTSAACAATTRTRLSIALHWRISTRAHRARPAPRPPSFGSQTTACGRTRAGKARGRGTRSCLQCDPALPRYVYRGDHRATPWQRLAYISRWAHSIFGRRARRASASLVGHIDRFPPHVIDMILAHVRDSIV